MKTAKTPESAEAHAEKLQEQRLKRHYKRRWPIYAAVIFTIEAVLAIGAWTLIYGSIKHRPVTARNDDVKITVQNARITNGDATYKPGNGYRYVILNAQFLNISSDTIWLAPVVQTYVKDNANHQYELAPASVIDPLEANPLAAGQQRGGQLSYVVPADSKDLSFCFIQNPKDTSVCLPLSL